MTSVCGLSFQLNTTPAYLLNNYLNSIEWEVFYQKATGEDTILNLVNPAIAQFGIIFGRFSTSLYDDIADYCSNNSDWQYVLLAKRLAELAGYNSEKLTYDVVQALEHMPMIGYLPKTNEVWNGRQYAYYFSVYNRFLLHAYKWAEQVSGDIDGDGSIDILDAIKFSNSFLCNSNSSNWNYYADSNGDGLINDVDASILAGNFGQCELLAKWNSTCAYQQLASLVDKYGGGFLFAGVDTALATDQGNCRYYDDEAQTLGCFHVFEEDGIPIARTYEDKIWSHLNSDGWWSGEWYWYRPNWHCFETEMAKFAIVITEYLGYVHPNIVSDLSQKLLINGWNSPCWQPWGYVVNHANNPDGSVVSLGARTEETLAVWEALESFYPSFGVDMQMTITDMLTEEPTAFEQVLNGTCYNNDKIDGAMVMFLNCIVPESGSIRDSLTEECYEGCYLNFPSSEFRFDYVNRMIRIPTTSGQIGFQFGSKIVSYNFTQGVWDIHFSDDWNTIDTVTLVSS